MRDPSYPCKKRIKKGCLVEIPTIQLPQREGNLRHPSPGSPTAGGGASGGHRAGGELAKAQHRCRDWPPLDFCRDAGCPIILSFVFEKSRCLSCRSGRAKRLDRFAANVLLLLNGVQVNMQLKPRCNQSAQCHFPMVYCGGKGSEACFCE